MEIAKVRDRAAIGLGELGDADLVDELVDRLTRRGSYYSDEQARVACRMLERVGDTRATSELIAAYVDGFRPVQVAEGLAGLRVAALGPLVAAAEQHPEIAKRKSTGEILKALHPHTVASYLETRMRLLAEEPEVVARAKLLMRLAAYDAAVRARVAEALGEVAASASAPIEKKLRKLLTTNEGGGAPVAARPC